MVGMRPIVQMSIAIFMYSAMDPLISIVGQDAVSVWWAGKNANRHTLYDVTTRRAVRRNTQIVLILCL